MGRAVEAAGGSKIQRAFGRTAIPDRGSYIGIGKGMDYCDSSVGFEPKKSAAVVDAVLTIDAIEDAIWTWSERTKRVTAFGAGGKRVDGDELLRWRSCRCQHQAERDCCGPQKT